MPAWDWYLEIPIITRVYLTTSVVTTAACALELVSPFSLYFNAQLVVYKFQVWRLLTNFFFFGALGLDFLFHMFFLVRYCRLLEEGRAAVLMMQDFVRTLARAARRWGAALVGAFEGAPPTF